MKKFNFLSKSRWLLVPLVLFTLGIGNAWGDVAAYKQTIFSSSNQPNNSSYTSTFTNTTSGFAVTVGNGNNNNNGWSGHVKFGRKNATSVGYVTTQAAIDKKVKSVSVNIVALTSSKINSITLYTSSNGSSWSSAGTFTKGTGTKTVTISSPTANLYYKIEFDCASGSSNGLIEISQIDFNVETFTVSYNSNGGSGTMTDSNSPYFNGSEVTVKSNSFTRSGYTFDHWDTKDDDSGTDYDASDKFTIAANTTLYAQWASSGTSVSLTKAATTNGSITLSPASSVTTTSGAQDVTVTATPNTGYYLSNLTATNPTTGTATVAADFSKVTYSSGANGSSTITATFSPIWQLRGDFNSWDDSDPLTSYSNGVATITKTLDANTKYEFQFYDARQSTDAARYHGNNGCIVEDISGWQFNTGSPAPNAKLFTGKAGTYTFKFTLSNRNLQIIYPEVTDHPNASYNYFKKWADWNNSFYVHWWGASDLTGYNNAIQVTKSVNICETDYVYFPILADYTNFIVKTAASGDGAHKTGDITSANSHGGDYHDCTSWREFETYTISYAGGTGSSGGPMASHSGICPGGSQKLTACAFSKTDYTFAGWSDGNGHTYADEATITNIQSNITLTAQWVLTPVITVSATSSINMGILKVDDTSTKTFTVSGSNLTSDITLAITTADADYVYYSIDKTTLSPTAGSVGTTTITITYTPTTNGVHNVNHLIEISATGAETKYVSVTGAGHYVHSYVDNIWGTDIADKTDTYDRPTISDKDPGAYTDCQHLHYHFVGWITKTKYDAGTTIDTRTAPTGDIQATGSVAKPTSNETFYAVWEKAAAGGGSSSYTLVTDASVLSAGDKLVFASSDETSAYLLGYQKSNNRGLSDATTITSNSMTPTVATLNSETAKAFVIDLEGSSGSWYLHDAINGYLQATGGTSSNYLTCNNSNSRGNNDTWTIAVNSTTHVATIKTINTTTNNRGLMQYNSSSSLYACYATASQSDVYIFRKPGVTYEDPIATCGAEYTITIDKNNASATCTSCGAKVTANATALSNLVAPTWAGHQVDYYMVASADNSTKIAEADGTLASGVTVSGTPWTDANGKWVKGGDATFYAKWKATECVITLNNEGASSAGTESVTATYGASTNLTTSIEIPAKNGYDFGGYYTAAGGSGTKLINADGTWIASVTGYTNASKQWQLDATALELHAEWTLKSYTVTWVVNGVTEATQANVNYGTTYDALTQEPSVDDDALSSCGSDKFVGWVTQEFTGENGTAETHYEPYKVTAATVVDDTHNTFYAMFAKESGTAFTLDGANGSTQDVKMSCIISGTRYYATGTASSSGYSGTTDAASANTYTFTKVSDGIYTIKKGTKYVIQKTSGKTALDESASSFNWEISTPGSNGTWRVKCKTNDEARAIIGYKNTNSDVFGDFKAYATSNTTGGNASMYFDLELGSSNLTNYRTGCCSEKITLAVSDDTSGDGGTVTLKWNNADKSAGDQVSTCSAGTLVAKVTANPGYILTAMAISGTNKSITITPSDLTTGLPSTEEMTYSVAVQALATGTLTITPTFSRTYTATYELAGGETTGSTATVRYQSGATVTFVTPTPTKSGYNFTGWTVTKDGGETVSNDGSSFTMPADNVTITATWTEKTLTSISLGSASVEVYVGQYVEIPVTYDPADILTKNYTLVANPSYCVTTGSTITTLKITGGRAGVTITENKTETVSIKANADNTKTASVSVTVKPLPVDHYVDLIHGVTFEDKGSTIVNNELSATYTAPGYGDYSGSTTGDCETNHLHLVGWIDSEWADAHPKATHAEIIAAEGYHTAREAGMTASNKTYYAVWGDEQ